MYIENTTVRKCCPVCGKKFKPIQGTQKFCSHECYTIYAKAQREENKNIVPYFICFMIKEITKYIV